jgi:hypothetical protein
MVEFAFLLSPQAMCLSVAAPRLRSLLILALWALPMAANAQRQALVATRPAPGAPGDTLASQDSVVVVEAVRVRTAPSPSSLSIDQVPSGTALAIEAGSALGGPWIAVRFDERTAFVPREYVTMKLAPRAAVTAATPPAPPPQSPTPMPTRVAMTVTDTPTPPALAQRGREPVQDRPAPVRETPATIKETPAPVRQAGEVRQVGREASPEPRVSLAPASPTPAATRETARAEGALPAPQPAPKDVANDPSRTRRPALPGLVSISLLGSVAPYTVTTTGAKVLHVSGHTLVSVSAFGWGVYAAPEYGSGAGHRSTMLGGGLLRQILRSGPVHVSALAGVTLYTEVPDGDYAASFVSRSIRASSVGGLITLPFVGPARIAYRGQYLRGLGADSDFHKIRHAVGLAF